MDCFWQYNKSQMGLRPSKQQESSPMNMSYAQCKELLAETVQLLKDNRQELMLNLQIEQAALKYVERNWKKSTLNATIQLLINGKGVPSPESIVLDMEQLYKICALLRHFHKDKKAETPMGTPKQPDFDEKECCICYAAKPTTALPCSHAYCDACTIKYIIEQEQRRCPECRREFTGDRTEVQKTFYAVIEEDKVVYEEARSMILEHLAKYNSKVINMLQWHLSQANRNEH